MNDTAEAASAGRPDNHLGGKAVCKEREPKSKAAIKLRKVNAKIDFSIARGCAHVYRMEASKDAKRFNRTKVTTPYSF